MLSLESQDSRWNAILLSTQELKLLDILLKRSIDNSKRNNKYGVKHKGPQLSSGEELNIFLNTEDGKNWIKEKILIYLNHEQNDQHIKKYYIEILIEAIRIAVNRDMASANRINYCLTDDKFNIAIVPDSYIYIN